MPYSCASDGCGEAANQIVMDADSGETNAWCVTHWMVLCRAMVDLIAANDPQAEVQLLPKVLSIIGDELQHAEMTIASKSGKAVAAKHLKRVYDAVRALDESEPEHNEGELDDLHDDDIVQGPPDARPTYAVDLDSEAAIIEAPLPEDPEPF